MDGVKPVHTLVLDAGAIIKNEPSVSTLLSRSENLVTVPAIISEIKDAAARSRVETTLTPFLTLRTPNPTSVKFVTDFARRTGDLIVLSKPDIQIIALAYEIECERNGGDWRLRRAPGQKGVNGTPPSKTTTATQPDAEVKTTDERSTDANDVSLADDTIPRETELEAITDRKPGSNSPGLAPSSIDDVTKQAEQLSLRDTGLTSMVESPEAPVSQNLSTSQDGNDSDGWITPSNLKKKQAEDAAASTVQSSETKTMQVAVLTSDFAMQNVILQINLNLLSPSMNRVKHLKNFVLRCHACFQVSKDMSKQFCPRCGGPTLTRVSCSTDANGEFKLHLKKNMQWNTRGDRYSIPKAVHGSANGRVQGGGKGGWGNDLILAEDQKEYQRASVANRKAKARDLMDEDYLPAILTGERGRAGGRIKVGAGRSVNATRR